MRKLFLLLAIAVTATSTAQPVINAVDYSTVAGETLHYYYNYNDISPVVPPLPAGAGVTWDFSWVTPRESYTSQITDCPSAMYCDSFPDCNLRSYIYHTAPGHADSSYSFAKSTSSTFSDFGTFYSDSVSYYSYYKSRTLHFPMQYNDFAMDTFFSRTTATGTFTVNYVDTTRIDAYGTLILPGGVFTNTLRMKRTTDVSSTHYVEYTWFDATHHAFLFLFNIQYDFGTDNPNLIDYIYRDGLFPTGIQNNAAIGSFTVSPNPAITEMNIAYSLSNTIGAPLQIYDATGRVVKQIDGLEAGDQHISVSTADMVPGVYILQLKTEGGIKREKIVVSH